FALSIGAMALLGSGEWKALLSAPKGYLLGGALGLVITVTVMLSIKGLDATVAISTILISQLIVAALIDAFGWLGQEKVAMDWRQYVGVALMLSGVVLFKLK
ncbi:MAG: DMT family transporter, partial [Eubacteriales bacterium]|nr:DMT family transporter [Eubacteriales bacterium]